MAIASMVIGIVFLAAILFSLLGPLLPIPGLLLAFSFLSYFMLTLPAGIAGLILGIIGIIRKSKRKIAITGVVLNALVFLWPVAVIVMWGIIGD